MSLEIEYPLGDLKSKSVTGQIKPATKHMPDRRKVVLSDLASNVYFEMSKAHARFPLFPS